MTLYLVTIETDQHWNWLKNLVGGGEGGGIHPPPLYARGLKRTEVIDYSLR